MVMTSDETQIQIFANWPMSHAKRVRRDNWKNPEYHVIAAIRKLRTDTNCPAGKPWPRSEALEPRLAHSCRSLYPGFCSMKRLEVFLLPLDGMLVHRRSLPRNFARFPQQFAGTHLYTWNTTQHNVPGQGSNPDRSLRSRAH